MGIFSKSTDPSSLTLVFDIGSSSIGGAIFCTSGNGIPKIVFAVREPIAIAKKIDFEKFFPLALKSLAVVTNKICMARLGVPDKIFCVLSSPWYVSQIRTINFEKNAPFILTQKFADNLIQKEISLFEEEYLKENNGGKNDICPIELKNMKTVLNGYPVPKPLNQKAKRIEMTLFLSMSTKWILEKIEENIGKHFSCKKIKFSSFALAAFSAVRDIFIQQDNFLLVDVGGEITDISLVKKEVLSESISFPIGSNYLIREMASALDCTTDEAKAYFSLMKDDHLGKSADKKIGPVLEKLKAEWLKKFEDALANLSDNVYIPSTVFLTTDRNLSDFFSEIIKSEQFTQYSFAESKFKVVFLGTQALHGIASFKENVDRDPILTLESIYLNRFVK